MSFQGNFNKFLYFIGYFSPRHKSYRGKIGLLTTQIWNHFVTLSTNLILSIIMKHIQEVVWTWTNRDSTATIVRSSYLDRFLLKRVDVGFFDCLIFHSIVYTNHRIVGVRVCLDMTAGMWWYKLKSKIMSFSTDYSRQFSLVRLAAQTVCEYWSGE